MCPQPKSTARSERNPDSTRRRILEAAFEQIHHRGYQGMRLDEVLAVTGLTKGALYHHFPNKRALGYAVVDTLVREMVETLWVRPLADAEAPLDALIRQVRDLPGLAGERVVTLGCPLNNLAQEMSPLDEGFRRRLDETFTLWHRAVAQALTRARDAGQMRADVDPEQAATFIVAALEGCIGMAKNAQSLERLAQCGAGLVGYLQSLGSQASDGRD
ncbi:MAG TPA: TetR/AcrR family transcriptional regulator [Gammaproteobacteria bacterium]|nr:TetR/AcrR family transcriptional regulator [Gammaproteobacteria bacterium]